MKVFFSGRRCIPLSKPPRHVWRPSRRAAHGYLGHDEENKINQNRASVDMTAAVTSKIYCFLFVFKEIQAYCATFQLDLGLPLIMPQTRPSNASSNVPESQAVNKHLIFLFPFLSNTCI